MFQWICDRSTLAYGRQCFKSSQGRGFGVLLGAETHTVTRIVLDLIAPDPTLIVEPVIEIRLRKANLVRAKK